jgi:hypothetical protein
MIYHEQEIDNFLDTEPEREAIKLFCQHYALAFYRSKIEAFSSKGGKALWAKLTPEQKKERIDKMVKARGVDKSK